MRAAAERLLSGRAGFHSVIGTAEATTLAGESVDFIVAAQPKLAVAAMDVARPLPTADVISLESLHSTGLRSAPELPPPRVSAC